VALVDLTGHRSKLSLRHFGILLDFGVLSIESVPGGWVIASRRARSGIAGMVEKAVEEGVTLERGVKTKPITLWEPVDEGVSTAPGNERRLILGMGEGYFKILSGRTPGRSSETGSKEDGTRGREERRISLGSYITTWETLVEAHVSVVLYLFS